MNFKWKLETNKLKKLKFEICYLKFPKELAFLRPLGKELLL